MQPTPYKRHDLPVERTVLEQFLAEPRWSRAGLHVKLERIDPSVVDGALVALFVEGLVIRDGAERWLLAPCVSHLHALDAIPAEAA